MHRANYLGLCLAAVLAFTMLPGASFCAAQDFPGLMNPFSPLFSFPPLQGEAKATIIWANLLKGKETIQTTPVRVLDFKDFWGMDKGATFIDALVRLQMGPLSARLNYAMRYFKGIPFNPGNTQLNSTVEAAFDYTGLRIGGDFDVLRWGRSRIGIDMDYDLYHPMLTATSLSELTGPSALTLGFHAVYNPSYNLYGFSAVAEGRARWSVVGSTVTDWEVAGGLRSPETVLGVMAIRSGYRQTKVSFNDWLGSNVQPTPVLLPTPAYTNVDVTMGGWFGELAYYY
jgi:hypothetical protein